MLLTVLTALLLSPTPAVATPLMAAPACITMNNMPPAGRKSPLDSLSFKVGAAEVKVCYGRPSSNGRVMLGGTNVPYDKLWRTGANEPTMIHTSAPITVAGVAIPAGSYSLYTIPGAKSWTIIVNRSITQWGHESTYTAEVKAKEVGTGKVTPEALSAPVEMFTITSQPGLRGSTELVLTWEKTRVTIPVTAGT